MTPARLPPHAPGMRIGLYGGTFDPAHAGHRHVSLLATKRLRLDRAWWIVTPGNPLKERGGLAPACERAAAARGRRASPSHRRHLLRGGDRRTLHGGYPRLRRRALPGGALRLDHGSRQPGELPPLARMGAHRRADALRGRRPARLDPAGRPLARRHGPVAAPHRRKRRRPVAAARAARLGVPARAAFAPVVIGASSKGAKLRPVGRLKSQAAH